MQQLFAAISKLEASDIGYYSVNSDEYVVKNILNAVYLWAGIVAVIIIIVSGFFYVISRSDPNQVSRAKNTLMGAVVGLAIILLAFVITNTLITGVTLTQ